MAPGAGVVVVEPTDGVEPEHSANFRDLMVDPPAEPSFESARDSAREAECGEVRTELGVQPIAARDGACRRRNGSDASRAGVLGAGAEGGKEYCDRENPRMLPHRRSRS